MMKNDNPQTNITKELDPTQLSKEMLQLTLMGVRVPKFLNVGIKEVAPLLRMTKQEAVAQALYEWLQKNAKEDPRIDLTLLNMPKSGDPELITIAQFWPLSLKARELMKTLRTPDLPEEFKNETKGKLAELLNKVAVFAKRNRQTEPGRKAVSLLAEAQEFFE